MFSRLLRSSACRQAVTSITAHADATSMFHVSGPSIQAAISTSYYSRSFVSATLPLNEKKTIAVPTMGDSITEGTIVEWTAQIGQAVKVDDVVAMIETDKVTIEIKADTDGVVTQHFGAVDETVEVGASLYEIDTEGQATVEASGTSEPVPEPSASSKPPTTESPPAAEPIAAAASSSHRVPSISFLGKEGWAQALIGQKQTTAATPTPSPSTPLKPNAVTSITVDTIHPLFGRPQLSAKEMEALLFGGANLDVNDWGVDEEIIEKI